MKPSKVYAYGPRMRETFNLHWRSDHDARETLVQSNNAGRYLLRGSRGPHGICRRNISGCQYTTRNATPGAADAKAARDSGSAAAVTVLR
jgi:hypothetical protein